MLYSITLFLCFVFWFYFDSIFNQTIRTYLFYLNNEKTTENILINNMFFGFSMVLKISFWLILIYFLFNINLKDVIIAITGFSTGFIWSSKSKIVDNIVLSECKKETFKSLFTYTSISYISFFLYFCFRYFL